LGYNGDLWCIHWLLGNDGKDCEVMDDPFPGWEVYPEKPWNYGLSVDKERPERSFRVQTSPISRQPFVVQDAPVRLIGKGRRISIWLLEMNALRPIAGRPRTGILGHSAREPGVNGLVARAARAVDVPLLIRKILRL
jgi:hypothetical protein